MIGKMIGKLSSIGLVCFGLTLLSCMATQAPEPPTAREPAGPATAVASRASWEEDWARTLAAARQEGPLIIYGAGGDGVRVAIGKSVKEKYGLDIEWVAGLGATLTARIVQERRVGLFVPDFIMGGTTNQQAVLKPEGMLDPIKPLLVLPETLNREVWFGGEIPWVDNDKMYTMTSILSPDYRVAVNTTIVRPEEIKSYNNLLDPRWMGKIVVRNPMGSMQWFSQLLQVMGPDFVRKLAANSPAIVENDRQGVEWLAQGKVAIMIIAQPGVLEEFVGAGAPVAKAIPQEASFIAGAGIATSLLNRAPHPNAAKVYVNWYLSKEGGDVQSRVTAMQSARLDVAPDHLATELRRNPSVKYVRVETEDFFLRLVSDRKVAQEVFGPDGRGLR
ncbi:MAG: extracellular solute-binding protein [Chloroflexi bacterium]|nr:extracellular solute-binding protein [Chloroflexota bacterium]